MATKHWGEIPLVLKDNIVPDVSADIKISMKKNCLDEYRDDKDSENVEKIVLPPMDPLMMYAISLHKYANDMTKLTELATDMNLIPPEDAAPPMPIMPKIELRHKRNKLNYIPKDFTPFTCGLEVDIPELSEAIVKQISTKCVVTMFAHIGFETSHQSVVDVLVDVLETFFQKFCHKIVEAIEDEEKGIVSGFPNAVERVLTETGMGGVRGLNDYYQNRVVKYVDVLRSRCEELSDNYAALLVPKSPPTIDNFGNVLRVKVEEDEGANETDNPEVHFTAFDGDTSVLETGLQLLNTLEAEESLQTMEEGGETDMTALAAVAEAAMKNFLPGGKKKRFK